MHLLSAVASIVILFSLFSTSASKVPSLVVIRQTSTDPIDTAPLKIGACLAIGMCYYNGTQTGCLTGACGDDSLLGSLCSCNADVQVVIAAQRAIGEKEWPTKCPYTV